MVTGDEERRRLAQETLARAARDSEAVGGVSVAERLADHFTGRDAKADGVADDPVEVWGRRLGRGLSLVFALALIWSLGWQLGWW